MKNLGTKISKVTSLIDHVVPMPCTDHITHEAIPGSPCDEAATQLDMGLPLWDVFYDRFFRSPVDEKDK